MHDIREWVHWWACPWARSQHQWAAFDLNLPTNEALGRGRHELISRALGITPCLPIQPSPALLRMVLAPPEQQALMLTLVDGIYHPQHDTALSHEQRQWCARLSMALPSCFRQPGEDPLHHLRAWVERSVWQRLRLSFAQRRVLELESQYPPQAGSKLDTVWQAVIWRASAATEDDFHADPSGGLHHVMPTQD
ncbi:MULTISPECIES: type III secretion protein [unclassified Pseudomonas]|uniref:type III secretion protein n=1 Tax=unclassified Pseudomonas TaxID=196821 RepID=UPI0021150E43|nr:MULTISPECIES: type III secretion protein [unclassified Pseudomonas]